MMVVSLLESCAVLPEVDESVSSRFRNCAPQSLFMQPGFMELRNGITAAGRKHEPAQARMGAACMPYVHGRGRGCSNAHLFSFGNACMHASPCGPAVTMRD